MRSLNCPDASTAVKTTNNMQRWASLEQGAGIALFVLAKTKTPRRRKKRRKREKRKQQPETLREKTKMQTLRPGFDLTQGLNCLTPHGKQGAGYCRKTIAAPTPRGQEVPG